jgi:hypothetical protein
MPTLALVGLLALLLSLPVAPVAHAAKKGFAQCMTDDGYGRHRPCSALYKRQHPNWRGGDECMTDDGYGRYRPCSAGYKKKYAK